MWKNLLSNNFLFIYFSSLFSIGAYFLHIFSGKKHGLGCCWYQNHIWLCLPMRLACLIMKLLRSSISLRFLPETPNPNRLKRNFLLILMMNCRSLIIIIFLHWFFFYWIFVFEFFQDGYYLIWVDVILCTERNVIIEILNNVSEI